MSLISPPNTPLDADLIVSTARLLLKKVSDEVRMAMSHHSEPNPESLRDLVEDASGWEEIAEELVYGPQTRPVLLASALGDLLEGEGQPTLVSEGYGVERPTIVPGNLYVEGPLEISNALWVLGDCFCEGVISDEGPDSHVVILGNLRAPALMTSGEFCVLGDVETLMILGQHNDNSLVVGGNVTTQILYEDDHDVSIMGTLDARLHASADMPDDERFALMAAWLDPRYIIDPENFEIDLEGLCEAMNQGEEPILEAPRVIDYNDYDE
ncbi:MAG: hypothetical protein VYE40_08240 [Myxococcota bacterium]|jgi:hypothetical protein|nr:hypothetical protein [Myxococcota bacterium]